MMEPPQAIQATRRSCPQCGIDLAKRGIYEVRNAVSAWTRWRPEPAGRWEVMDEDIEYADGSTLECAACGETLAQALADALLNAIEQSSAA